jgi:hypothetical protein
MAPDIHVHKRGIGYAHGGISVQECVVPQITVESTGGRGTDARIAAIEWVGLRCRVQVESPTSGLRVDLRTRPNDGDTSVSLRPKQPKEDGTVSLPVPAPSLEGEDVTVVLLDDDRVIHTSPTVVGGHE